MRWIVISKIAIILFIVSGFAKGAQGQGPASPSSNNQQGLVLPMKKDSVRFAVIGDTGTGLENQRQLAELMNKYRDNFKFDFVLMLGDNLYGSEHPKDYIEKFESIYKKLMDSGVKFYATLGNHDDSNQRNYDHFNMSGKEYYSIKKGRVTFWALNSNYMDQSQIKWLDEELAKEESDWKICFFHHPLYSSGKQHGSNTDLQKVLEPLFVKHGVNVVFAGHEHFYERIKPQKGIYHFISGAGGKLRPGDVRSTKLTEKSFDQDLHFMLVEIADNQMHFQVISGADKTVDSGMITNPRQAARKEAKASN
jgi:predicted phosphodiesterase